MSSVSIIGAGLAGCEAALVLSRAGIAVKLYEMRPHRTTPAHKTDLPAELVCSNSFKAIGTNSAHGLLKEELLALGSPLLEIARTVSVPAGSALAVDRVLFSHAVLEALAREPGISFVRRECGAVPADSSHAIIAAGPLASEAITGWIQQTFSGAFLSFYDAIAPIVAGDSVDMTTAFFGERNDPNSTDYINCPFTKEEYDRFFAALIEADKAVAQAFEDARFFEACLPVEVIASRGVRALAFGVLKPIGFIDPRTARRPYALGQLRRENHAGDSYNMVGFQTRLTIGEQRNVFRLIPGLEHAEFLRYGSIHRNTYIDSPQLLATDLSFKQMPSVFCAGQLSGSEGYTESVATGHLAALAVLHRLREASWVAPPRETALGALLNHVTRAEARPFTPSNINFGLFPTMPPLPGIRKPNKKDRDARLCERARENLAQWKKSIPR